MMRKKKFWLLGLAILLFVLLGIGIFEPSGIILGYFKGEKTFQGRPTTYWRRALGGTDPAVQNQALQNLEKGGADALPVLIELIQIQDQGDWEAGEIRRTAAELVGRLGSQGQSAVPALVASLKDPDRHFRAAVASALGQVGGQNPQACAALVDLLKT